MKIWWEWNLSEHLFNNNTRNEIPRTKPTVRIYCFSSFCSNEVYLNNFLSEEFVRELKVVAGGREEH